MPTQLPDSLGALAVDDKQARDDQMATVSPKAIGTFSPNALNKLVASWNKLSKLFGISEPYPVFAEPLKVFPVDFTKLLVMASKAIEDAVEAEVISSDLLIDLPNTKKDQDVILLAAKLGEVAKSPEFKSFLMEAPPEPTEPVVEEAEPLPAPMDDDAMMNMFASRMPVKP